MKGVSPVGSSRGCSLKLISWSQFCLTSSSRIGVIIETAISINVVVGCLERASAVEFSIGFFVLNLLVKSHELK